MSIIRTGRTTHHYHFPNTFIFLGLPVASSGNNEVLFLIEVPQEKLLRY